MQTIKFNSEIHPSYKQQFDKLTEAYIKNEVNPYSSCGCFVGNLLHKSSDWLKARSGTDLGILTPCNISIIRATACIRDNSAGLYTIQEILDLEKIFMISQNTNEITYVDGEPMGDEDRFAEDELTDNDEHYLFIAFEKTLDLLRTIHESKGEAIDAIPEFKKRALCTQ